jgi:glycoside/pentoside/hexuronide:cation symporter, GPH family
MVRSFALAQNIYRRGVCPAVGVWFTFSPSENATPSALQWQLIVGLALTYLGFSAITIAYHAWGGEWSNETHERTRIATWREGAGLVGVLIAAALPVVFAERFGAQRGYVIFALALMAVLILSTMITLLGASQKQRIPPAKLEANFSNLLMKRSFRRLLAVFAVNGIAAAIPATLFLFFAEDVVKAADWQAQFLAVYFLAGALATPAWLAISKRYGKANAWGASMLLAIVTFIWAYGLGADNRIAFLCVCVLSGLALGADLTLPPSMLADVIASDGDDTAAGAYFGVWTMVSKLNLALAAGIALPALAWLGYEPGAKGGDTQSLSVAYAILPCVLKLFAFGLLWKWKDHEFN